MPLLLAPNSELCTRNTQIDFVSANPGEFNANPNRINCFAKIYRWSPCSRSQRVIRFGRFLQCGVKQADPIAQALKLQSFQACSSSCFDHSHYRLFLSSSPQPFLPAEAPERVFTSCLSSVMNSVTSSNSRYTEA